MRRASSMSWFRSFAPFPWRARDWRWISTYHRGPARQRIYALAKAIVRALQPGNGRSHRCESGGRTALEAVQGLSAKQRQIMDLGDAGVEPAKKPDEGSDNDTDAKG